MSNVRFVGLDVHKNAIILAVADSSAAPAESLATLPWSEDRLIAQLRKLALHGPLKICYEAGPTGYGLQRALAAAGRRSGARRADAKRPIRSEPIRNADEF